LSSTFDLVVAQILRGFSSENLKAVSDQRYNHAPGWVEDVRLGKFESLPDPLTWEMATEFVYLLNGYEVFGADELGTFANRKSSDMKRQGKWTGSAKDLWLCLFYENRRWRHFGEWPQGSDLENMDDLCRALREALVALDERGRNAIVVLMATYPCPWN